MKDAPTQNTDTTNAQVDPLPLTFKAWQELAQSVHARADRIHRMIDLDRNGFCGTVPLHDVNGNHVGSVTVKGK